MASQNPFTTFFTSEDRLTLARKLVQGISDFNPAACAKIALTFALNPSLMDDLTMKNSRRIMELAKQCSELPWTLPASAVLDPDQSALPTQTLAEPRTTDAVPAATAVAAQSAPAPTDVADQSATAPADVAAQSATAPADVAAQSTVAPAEVSATTAPDVAQQAAVPPLPRAVIDSDSSAVHAAEASAPTATEVAQRIAVPPLPRATPAAPMPQVSAALPQVRNAAATQSMSKIPSSKIGVPSVLSSGSLNYQVPSSLSLCSKSESKVLLPFPSSKSHDIQFGSFSQPMPNESASDLASSEKLVSDVISHNVSLVAKLPTSDLSLDSISVSIPENQSVPIVSVPLSALDQCNPVASRTRKSKAKLANRVIPVAPSVKRKLMMDSVSGVEPPRKSQKSVSTRQLRGQVSVPQSLPKSSSSGFPLPILLNKDLQAAWVINKDRSLLLQRNIDVENFTACCNLIDLLRYQNLLQTVTHVGPYCDLVTREFYTNLTEATMDRDSAHFHNVYIRRHWYDFSPAVINVFFDRTEVDVQFSPDYDLIASSLSNSHYRTSPKRDTKKPGKQGDIESSFLPSSYAILLRMATTNWLPTVTVHSVSKKMVVLLFKIRNNIPFNLGELIFDHIMAFRHGQGKEDKVLLPFSSLIYESVPSNLPCVSVDFADVRARVLSTQSILTSLKSTVVRMEKVLLDDKKLLQSFEAGDVGSDSAPSR
nr:uncharacterized protein LOC109166029 [Ipomoea batatas]